MFKKIKFGRYDFFAIKVYLLLQLVVFFFASLSSATLLESRGFTAHFFEKGLTEPLVFFRGNFDGIHYLEIARSGYGYLQQAFFPFYPRLIRFLSLFLGSYLWSGILISHFCFAFALVFLGRLLELEGEKERVIKNTLLLISFFPASFYFLNVYTESLFLLLAVLSFYLARQKKWFWASLIGGLAAYTRIVGIFILPSLLVEYWRQRSEKGRDEFKGRLLAFKDHPDQSLSFFSGLQRKLYHLKNLFFICLSSWGFFAYGWELLRKHNDFFYFAHVQPSFGAQRSVDKLVLIYQVFWRYLRMIASVSFKNLIYYNVWQEFLTALLFLGLLFLGAGVVKRFKIPPSYLCFSALAYVLPTLTGTFLSLPRLVLVIFPGFWVLGRVIDESRWFKTFYLAVTAFFLVWNIILFSRGVWVS